VLYQKMRERLDGNAHDAGGTDSPNSSKGRVT
jgi:hypothetical protein